VIGFLLRRPGLVALLTLVVTLAGFVLTGMSLKLDGDVARAIKGRSEAYTAFIAFEAQFAAPSKDEVLLVQSTDLGAEENFAALEDLIIDLQLSDGVLGVLSVFSVPDPEGGALSYLARTDLQDVPPGKRLDDFLTQSHLARQVMAADRSATILSVIPDLDMPVADRLAALDAVVQETALTVTPVGLSALQRQITDALISDQLFLAPMSIVICLGLAFLIFRSWRAALICGIPPVLGLGWTFGFMALTGIAMDPLMSIVPTVLIVLAIADTVHVYHAILRQLETQPLKTAIAVGMAETMPAVVLASATTAVAFLSLFFVGSPTLQGLAIVGPVGLALTLIAVLISVPLSSLFLLNKGALGREPVGFVSVIRLAVGLLPRWRWATGLALITLAALLFVQRNTVPGFNLLDHVPRGSEFRQTLAALDAALPGSDQLYVVVDAADPAPGVSRADRDRLRDVSAAIYGASQTAWPEVDPAVLDTAVAQRVFGIDGAQFALPVPARLSDDWRDTLARADEVEGLLAAAAVGDVTTVTSYSLMASVELPLVVKELRLSFYIAVGLVTVLAAVLMRSVVLALLSLVPNLIPILGVELWLIVSGLPMTITGAIALTIAFGIAVDDTIHLLNRLRVARTDHGEINIHSLTDALSATVPPVVTTSLILLAGFSMTIFSQMPSVAVFGQLVASAMLLALIADLFLFPSLLLWGRKFHGSL